MRVCDATCRGKATYSGGLTAEQIGRNRDNQRQLFARFERWRTARCSRSRRLSILPNAVKKGRNKSNSVAMPLAYSEFLCRASR